MCGRYCLPENDEEMRAVIEQLQRAYTGETRMKGEVAPTDTAPVIALSRRLDKRAFAMRWGYDTPAGLVINARSETAAQKPLFADGMAQRRCLIPACWYFEWERRGRERVRYAIGAKESGLVYMAGLYRVAAQGAQFVVLTRGAAQDVAFIHPRMPVMLPKAAHAAWLDPNTPAQDVLAQAVESLRFGAA